MFKGFILSHCDVVALEERPNRGNLFFFLNRRYYIMWILDTSALFQGRVTKIKIIMGFRYWILDNTVFLKRRDIRLHKLWPEAVEVCSNRNHQSQWFEETWQSLQMLLKNATKEIYCNLEFKSVLPRKL